MYCVYLGRSVGTISPPDGSVSDVKITNMSASKLTGALPAISGAALTGVESAVKSASDPTITSNKILGTEWINTTTGEVYILTTDTTNQNVWTNIGDGTGTIQPNQPPGNPTDNVPDMNESATLNHTFIGGTDADGTVTHYIVDTISNSSLLAVTTAEVAAGTAHVFTSQAVSADTNVTFRVRSKDNLGSYSSGITVTTAILNLVPYDAHFLVVAGGGSSNKGMGGGSGGGGLRTSWPGGSGGGAASQSQTTFIQGTVYTITVGGGGVGQTTTNSNTNGNSSNITGSGYTTITTAGGGYGASYNTPAGNGGSGGGGSTDGQGTTGEGFAGHGVSGYLHGGGGGAGIAATDQTGGVGKQVNIDGNNWYWSGGGGGGLHGAGTAGGGGFGGGGGGSAYCNSGQGIGSGGGNAINAGAAGVCSTSGPPGGTGGVNSGGGGGGGNDSASRGTHGGSGIIILRIPTASYSGTHTGNETPITSGSDTIVTWKGVGTYTA
jgi:hypothetical protein